MADNPPKPTKTDTAYILAKAGVSAIPIIGGPAAELLSFKKLDALRAAVLNSAQGSDLDDDLQAMFLGYIDTLTPIHLRLLTFLSGPDEWVESRDIKWPSWSTCGVNSLIEHAIPKLKGQRAIYDKVGEDLYNAGLISTESFHTTGTFQGMRTARTSDLGNRFIQFITTSA